jgi:hypothetical protein
VLVLNGCMVVKNAVAEFTDYLGICMTVIFTVGGFDVSMAKKMLGCDKLILIICVAKQR